ncbi:hypothetical protein GCM10027563_05510 [Parasphingorhabdus pacifica]
MSNCVIQPRPAGLRLDRRDFGVMPTAHGLANSADSNSEGGAEMAKRARKKKDRKKNNANHGKRPNC